MSSRTYTKPKNKDSTTITSMFKEPSYNKDLKSESIKNSNDVISSNVNHSFSNLNVHSNQSFKQSCPLSLSSPSLCPFGGACQNCPLKMQTKLKIGQPSDKFEKEADSVADMMMRIPDPEFKKITTGVEEIKTSIIWCSYPKCKEVLKNKLFEEEKTYNNNWITSIKDIGIKSGLRDEMNNLNHASEPMLMMSNGPPTAGGITRTKEQQRCIALGCPVRIFRPAHGGNCTIYKCFKAPNYRGIPFTSPGACTYKCPDGYFCSGVLINFPFWGYRFQNIVCLGVIEGGRAETEIVHKVLALNEGHLRDERANREKGGEILQAKSGSDPTLEVTPELEATINAIKGAGQPLPKSVRIFFEPRFGHDFSDIRIHSDSLAVDACRAINARAFTAGRDIVFGTGQYTPDTTRGRQLLAHELTHVIQQQPTGTTTATQVRFEYNWGNAEREADVTANRVAVGKEAQVMEQADIGIQRSLLEAGIGALAGAGTGALIGAIVGGAGGAVIGAGIGAVAGGIIGALSTKAKTVTINITVLNGARDNSAADIGTSNIIFSRAGCGLRVAAGKKQTLNASQTRSILRSDNRLDEPSGAVVSAEERQLIRFNRNFGRITAYYVPAFNPSKRGTSLQSPRHGVADSLLMGNSAAQDTFTHELGHILARDPKHNSDPNNLMARGSIRNIGVDNVTTTQCNSFLKTTSYPT